MKRTHNQIKRAHKGDCNGFVLHIRQYQHSINENGEPAEAQDKVT